MNHRKPYHPTCHKILIICVPTNHLAQTCRKWGVSLAVIKIPYVTLLSYTCWLRGILLTHGLLESLHNWGEVNFIPLYYRIHNPGRVENQLVKKLNLKTRWWLSFNPFEKYYIVKMGDFLPQGSGVKIKICFELPPPRKPSYHCTKVAFFLPIG